MTLVLGTCFGNFATKIGIDKKNTHEGTKSLKKELLDQNKILTKERFCFLVEKSIFEKKQSCIEAVVDICEEHDLEYEKLKPLLNKSIIDKIEHEARDLNFLEKVNTLPL